MCFCLPTPFEDLTLYTYIYGNVAVPTVFSILFFCPVIVLNFVFVRICLKFVGFLFRDLVFLEFCVSLYKI